ncbi:MAG: terminase TerL endonuclease subunit [Thiolinea sp.]
MNLEQQKVAKSYLEKARNYAYDVLAGHITVCKWVKLAVERDENDRKAAHERGLYFDEYDAARVLVFFSYLKHYKGEWRGQFIHLEPWQCWIISVVFGWKRKNGKRRYREVYEEVARKNGKTIKLAGIGGYMLLLDKEGAPEIYAAATTRDQSKRLWRDAAKMLGYATSTRNRIRIKNSISEIESPRNDGFFIPLSREAEAIDGSNPHAGLVDELHAHPTSEIYDVIMSGMGARSQPVLWSITTAGAARPKEESICLQKREYACHVLDGTYQDDEFFGIIYTLDDGDDWANEENWIKANPNLEYLAGYDANGDPFFSGSVKRDYLQGQVTKAKNSPVLRYGVLTKNFNLWQSNAMSWANLDLWDKCGVDVADKDWLESFRDATVVYGGLDLASVSDLTSLALLAIMPDGEKRLWVRSWLPEAAIQRAVSERGVPYDQWVEQGWIIVTPGLTTDYSWIHADLTGFGTAHLNPAERPVRMPAPAGAEGLLKELPIEIIGADDWAMARFFQNLAEEARTKFGKVGQGYRSMSPAMKEFEALYQSGRLVHNNNPVLRWAMGNVVAVVDPAENVKPDKKKSSEKIDPVVASLNAVFTSLAEHEESLESAYEEGVYI